MKWLEIAFSAVLYLEFAKADSRAWELWSSNISTAPPFTPNSTSPKRKYLIEGKLRHAASNGNFTLFKQAISLGGQHIDIWAGDRNGRTWLHFAVINGYGGDKLPSNPSFIKSAIGFLFPVGTPGTVLQNFVNIQDGSGQTPLHEAALNGWTVTFNTLLDLGV